MVNRCFLIVMIVLSVVSFGEGWSGLSKGTLAEEAFLEGNYKKALLLYEQALKEALPQERGPLMVEQAVVYYKDQNQENAFRVYLKALDETCFSELTPKIHPEDRALYEEGLAIALDPSRSAREAGTEVRRRYATEVALHEDYYLTNFLLASAYANLGMFEEFFERFYHSYQQLPDSFLSYKAQAALHIKLYERARSPEDREVQRCSVLRNMEKALEKNPSDSSLYKLTIVFASDGQQQQVLRRSLQRIIDDNIVVPRRDVYFYVQAAVSADQFVLAQRFIDKAKEWYRYSRSLAAAQKLVDRKKLRNQEEK